MDDFCYQGKHFDTDSFCLSMRLFYMQCTKKQMYQQISVRFQTLAIKIPLACFNGNTWYLHEFIPVFRQALPPKRPCYFRPTFPGS